MNFQPQKYLQVEEGERICQPPGRRTGGVDSGLIVRAVAGSSIAMCPPLIITETQIDEMIEKLGSALDKTLDYVRADNLLVA